MRGSKKFFRSFSRPLRTDLVPESVAAEPALAAVETADAITPRDEAIFLLHTAAEVEHALMTQYLYAAYSVDTGLPDGAPWQRRILGVAREEMGHLMTVQNVLHALGGPVNLEREDYPFESRLYPFPLHLTRLSLESLGRYVLAEMPPGESLSAVETEAVQEIRDRLGETEPRVNRVGELYGRLIGIVESLPAEDFDPSVSGFQALAEDWTASGTPRTGSFDVLIPRATSKDEALAALRQIAEQGEGVTRGPDSAAHFDIFLHLYTEIRNAGVDPSLPVPKDPNTMRFASDNNAGTITHPQAKRWAEFANSRYRLLLGFLSHFLQTPGPIYTATGERTARGYLLTWAFFEMRNLALIQKRIVQLPQTSEDKPDRAAIPFELPYTLALPVRERDRWRFHRQTVEAALQQVAVLRQDQTEDAGLLAKLEEFTQQQKQMSTVLETGALPNPAPAFRRVMQILEEAVRGFDVRAFHDNVWRANSEQELVSALTDIGFIMPGKRPNRICPKRCEVRFRLLAGCHLADRLFQTNGLASLSDGLLRFQNRTLLHPGRKRVFRRSFKSSTTRFKTRISGHTAAFGRG